MKIIKENTKYCGAVLAEILETEDGGIILSIFHKGKFKKVDINNNHYEFLGFEDDFSVKGRLGKQHNLDC